jgi:fructose-1,6-bisphosphatase II
MGIKDTTKTFTMDDLVRSDDAIFSATGITSGDILQGVRFVSGDTALTHTLISRAQTGTVRWVNGKHSISRKPNLVLV